MGNELHLIGNNVLNPPPKHRWFVEYLPVCGPEQIKLYQDGESYMSDLHADLKAAKQEICLTGLHFTGHMHLVRAAGCDPRKQHDPEALQAILAAASLRGVDVYLLVNQFWPDEPDVAARYWRAYRDLDKGLWKIASPIAGNIMASGGLPEYLERSYLFFQYLQYKGNREKIHCYTDIHQGYIFHSNHQKTIVVDRKIAYWGGIDLTDIDGDRWDTPEHKPGDPRRNFEKPERSWHDLHLRAQKKGANEPSAVDYIYANFLARYNHGYLYSPELTGAMLKKYANGPWHQGVDLDAFINELHCNEGLKTEPAKDVPKLSPDGKTARDYVPKKFWYYPRNIPKLEPGKVDYPIVQIVRSMPAGRFSNYKLHQHPDWNELRVVVDSAPTGVALTTNPEFEHSARDAYLKGIGSARNFIYLENQWVADDKIWAALHEAAKQNGDRADFHIMIVLPKKFLSAAGFGSEQTIDLIHFVERLAKIFADHGHPENFGLFSVLQPEAHQPGAPGGPPSRQWQVPECSWDYMYVHSKLLIVDDCWLLLGSANAGGISLTGIGVTSEPDAELSSIVLDERAGDQSVVRKFRKELWAEHLGLKDPAQVNDYREGIKLFHKQAMEQTYTAEKGRTARVHYNLLYFPISAKCGLKAAQDGWSNPPGAKPPQGLWWQMKWAAIQEQAKARVRDPDAIHQTYYDLSGPLTAVHMLLQRDPARYERLVKTVYTNAEEPRNPKDDFGVKLQEPTRLLHGLHVWIRPQKLVEFGIAPEHPILEVDWMLGSALTDSANWALDYQGQVTETTATTCSNYEMQGHLNRILPCRGGVDHLSCEGSGELAAAQRASLRLGADQARVKHDPPEIFCAAKIGKDLLFRFKEKEFDTAKAAAKQEAKKPLAERDARKSPPDKGHPDLWECRVADHPWLKLQRDRTYPLYPGVLTPYDVKHILGKRMYVQLLEPLEFQYKGDEIDKVRMRFWTWGANATLEVDARTFAKNVYGFFLAYYSNGARSNAEKKRRHVAKNVPLKAGWQREYRHDDVDKGSGVLVCHSGSLTVDMARRVWYTWDDLVRGRPVKAGESIPLDFPEASRVNDQDDRVRITATSDAVYSLEMESTT